MKKYKHLFFDLDHTLWDYDKNVQESLSELFGIYELQNLGILDFRTFLDAFYNINFKLWAMYDLGKIDKKDLRETRFKLIFEKAGARKWKMILCTGLLRSHICFHIQKKFWTT